MRRVDYVEQTTGALHKHRYAHRAPSVESSEGGDSDARAFVQPVGEPDERVQSSEWILDE